MKKVVFLSLAFLLGSSGAWAQPLDQLPNAADEVIQEDLMDGHQRGSMAPVLDEFATPEPAVEKAPEVKRMKKAPKSNDREDKPFDFNTISADPTQLQDLQQETLKSAPPTSVPSTFEN